MIKKTFTCILLLILLWPVPAVCNGIKNTKGNSRPNILFITIEDTSPWFLGCYGNSHARTPAIDKLSEEGVRFTNAFSTGTVCSPSRTAIITGVKTYKTGSGNHRSKFPLPEFIKGFPYYLQQQGYYTTNNSKTDYNVANEKKFIREAWNEDSNQAGWWGRKQGQPFFAVFNFMESHQSRTMTETYDWYVNHVLEKLAPEERIDDDGFELPPFYNDSREMRRQFARVYNSISLTDKKIGELLLQLEEDNLKDSTIIFFFADHGEGMPRGKTNGIDYGYRVPFIIWFPEIYKHLSPWGTAGAVSHELVDFTDLAPTLISLAGGEIPQHLEGRPFLGKERTAPPAHLFLSSDRSDNGIDMVRTVTDGRFMYSRNYMPYINELRYIRYMEIGEIKQQMRNDLKDNRLNILQKSLFEPRPAEFLYDTQNDRWETTNLADDPRYEKILLQMRNLHREEVLTSRDIMFLPEYSISQLPEATTAYQLRLDRKNYLLEEIYEAASLSGFRSRSHTERQVALLQHDNPYVRFWAIMGLRNQHPDDLISFGDYILQAMNDPYLPVAVAAASVAYSLTGKKEAEDRLKHLCTGNDNHITLMAIHMLLYTENRDPFIETIHEVYKMPGRDYNVKAACMDFLGSLGLVPNNPDFRE